MLALYEERLVSLWARVVRTLGIHTARLLLERAIKQTAQRHPDIALLQHDDGGLTFEALETRYANRPHAPLIVLTAAHEAQARAAEINAEAWLAKPFHLVDLYACIDHWSSQGCPHGDPWA
jgi:DNA-binding response OmpR family regulator